MLHEQRGINWNNFPVRWKRGVACYKEPESFIKVEPSDGWAPDKEIPMMRRYWKIDYEMPILKGEDRKYVDRHIFVGE
jgi:tRNA(His) 5'-end guanylyltransferase